ncbi:RNA-binding S4 domain-containing protein [Proteocatella sphenisci]|uniref:RNA-binding S4 domain-containing protein n=1 Tax=Proteocatella sphenisci TaxID=181070 RepID=UPI00048F2ED4|nr:RNA-binding S4 domain-containing protein [Proteocatella sphenisci]
MRIDKFLKVSRIIKRRTVAKDASDAGVVMINGKEAKPSSKVKEGDILEITFGERKLKIKVLNIKDSTKKEDAVDMYEVIE